MDPRNLKVNFEPIASAWGLRKLITLGLLMKMLLLHEGQYVTDRLGSKPLPQHPGIRSERRDWPPRVEGYGGSFRAHIASSETYTLY